MLNYGINFYFLYTKIKTQVILGSILEIHHRDHDDQHVD